MATARISIFFGTQLFPFVLPCTNSFMFAVQKDEAGVVSILILIIIVIIKYYCYTEGPIGTELLKNL